MDVVTSEGPAQGKTIEEIYELQGDKLKICIALPGNSRVQAAVDGYLPTNAPSQVTRLHHKSNRQFSLQQNSPDASGLGTSLLSFRRKDECIRAPKCFFAQIHGRFSPFFII